MNLDNKKICEQEIKRSLLLIKYDNRKTLTENKELVNEVAPLVIPAITIAAPWLWATGVAAAAGIGTWIYNVQGGGDAFTKTQTFFQGCSSLNAKLKPTQDKSVHRTAADSIYDAIQGIGTKLPKIKEAISSMGTVADLCAMYKYYNKTYGDLYDDLDSDIDGEDFRRYVWSAISPIVDDAEADLEKIKNEDVNEDVWKKYPCVPNHDGAKKLTDSSGGILYEIGDYYYYLNGRKMNKDTREMSNFTCSDPPFKTTQQSYTECPGPKFNLYCKNEKIRELQVCLGMPTKYQTGNFGPITNQNLKDNNYRGDTITSEEIDKICRGTKTSASNLATQYGTTTPPKIQGGISGGQQGVGDVEVDPNLY